MARALLLGCSLIFFSAACAPDYVKYDAQTCSASPLESVRINCRAQKIGTEREKYVLIGVIVGATVGGGIAVINAENPIAYMIVGGGAGAALGYWESVRRELAEASRSRDQFASEVTRMIAEFGSVSSKSSRRLSVELQSVLKMPPSRERDRRLLEIYKSAQVAKRLMMEDAQGLGYLVKNSPPPLGNKDQRSRSDGLDNADSAFRGFDTYSRDSCSAIVNPDLYCERIS